MAVSIVATVGSATANSYVTLAAATTALEARYAGDSAAAWTAATDDVKNRALVEAQVELQVLRWIGTRIDSTQALAWPREGALRHDAPADADLGEYGFPTYDADEIPDLVVAAQVELAFQFVKAGTTDLAMPDATDGVRRKKVDVLETEYADPAYRATRGLSRYPRVWALIEPLLESSAGGLTVTRA